MLVSGLENEDYTNYKKAPTMFIGVGVSCSGKCWKELGLDKSICQNEELRFSKKIEVTEQRLVNLYLESKITKAVCFGGLEPLDNKDIWNLIKTFRENTEDVIIIYTGYKEDEVEEIINSTPEASNLLKKLRNENNLNIILKYGRYIPNDKPIFDSVLEVTLASSNQYAKYLK